MSDQNQSSSIIDTILDGISPERAALMKKAAAKTSKPAKKIKREIDLEKFGMQTEAEWLLIAPSRYEDYANETIDFKTIAAGNPVMIRGTILSMDYFKDGKKPLLGNFQKIATRLVMKIKNANDQTLDVFAFGKPYFAWKSVDIGHQVLIRAMPKPRFIGNGIELHAPEVVPRALQGKIVPVYPNLKVTKGEKFREKIDHHLHLMNQAADLVERETGWSEKNEVISFADLSQFDTPLDLLKALHRPTTVEQGEKARRAARLVSGLSLMRNTLLRSENVVEDELSSIPITNDMIEQLKKRLPFQITNDQEKAIDNISASLRSKVPMSGLLSGDVGSGKTAAFMVPLVATYKAGKRAMILTPNLLLIAQVAREIRATFPEVPVCTVTGSGIDGDPNAGIVVGSTALIHAFKKNKIKQHPDVLVIDEQHKFSIEQRQFLAGEHTNILEATATPIPRTAALISHGTADVFLLREIPVDKKITTEIITKQGAINARNEVLRAVLERGEQAAVVYPLVETDDEEKSKTAVTNALDQWKKYVPEDRIAVLHGKLKDDEKTAILDAFRAGEKDLLLCSIVIEVGVTLPSLKVMLVVDADNFGVVTLHQLRGRLARHGGEGHMMLYAEDPSPEGLERLDLLVKYTDGFVLAEKDAEVRGFGDLIGNDGDVQSGKTRTLFLGVNVGPQEIGFAANLYRRAGRMAELDGPLLLTETSVPTPASSEDILARLLDIPNARQGTTENKMESNSDSANEDLLQMADIVPARRGFRFGRS